VERYKSELQRLQEKIRGLEAERDASEPEKLVDLAVQLAELRPAESILQERLAEAKQEERERVQVANAPKVLKIKARRVELRDQVEGVLFGLVEDKLRQYAQGVRDQRGLGSMTFGDPTLEAVGEVVRRLHELRAVRVGNYDGYPWRL